MSVKQSNISFCLMQLQETDDIEGVLKTIRSIEGVVKCVPIRSRYHLLITMEGETAVKVKTAFLEKFQNDTQINRMDFISTDLSKSYFSESAIDDGKKKFVSSYLLFEVEQNGLTGLMDSLKKVPFVTACYPTKGSYDLLAEMKAPSFFNLHRTLTGNIRPLAGIRRCWMLNVINVTQL